MNATKSDVMENKIRRGTSEIPTANKSCFQKNELLGAQKKKGKAKGGSASPNPAGPTPPNHAAKITAQSIDDAMGSACSRRVISSATMIARATDSTAIA